MKRNLKKHLLATIILLALVAISCTHSPSERLIEITAKPGELKPICTPDALSILPGQKIRFRVTNYTDKPIEFLVVDDSGRNNRKSIISVSETTNRKDTANNGIRRVSITPIHDGHESEFGPDATPDYPYRLIVEEQKRTPGVRPMDVTFPEVGEALPPLTYFLCSYLDAEEVDEGKITRR